MTTDDLIIYIQNQLKKNVSNDLIISRLMQVGWQEDDINEGFIKANLINIPVTTSPLVSNLRFTPILRKNEEVIASNNFRVKEKVVEDKEIKKEEIVKTIREEKVEPKIIPDKVEINAYEIEAPIIPLELSQEKDMPKAVDTYLEEKIIPNTATFHAYEIEVPIIPLELNQEKVVPISADAYLEEKIIPNKLTLNANENKVPEILGEINQPKETLKVWTPMRTNPIMEEEVKIETIPEIIKIKDSEHAEITETEIKNKKDSVDVFEEFIPKLIEKKSNPNVEPIRTVTAAIPSAPVSPIVPAISVVPVPRPAPIISSVPKKDSLEIPIAPIKVPVAPKSMESVKSAPSKEKSSSVFMDLSGGIKQTQNMPQAFSGIKESVQAMPDDLPKKAMIASYSQDLLSASLVKEKMGQRIPIKIPTKLIIIIVIFLFLGAIAYGFIGGYLKIPNFNFSFIRQDPKVVLLKNGGMLAEVKSYKVETEASISLLSLSNITASLINGEDMGSSERDDVSISTKGQVNKEGLYQSDFVSTVKSSILKEGITINFMKKGDDSYATVSDFSKVFGGNIPDLGMIKLSKDKINLLSPELPLGLGDKAKELEIYQSILGGILEENKEEISSAFGDFIKDVKISKKNEEIIRGSDTYHYSISADKQDSKKLFTKLVGIILKDTPSDSRAVLDKLLGSITIETFDIWLGKEDNNIHQYKVVLKIPLSRVINYENKGIANSQIVFNLQSTYYDFDIVNQIENPQNFIDIDQFLKIVDDSKVKSAVSLFKINARSLFNAQGSFGKISNKTGLCDVPVSGSLFSPLGHTAGASNAVGEIAKNMNEILSQTGNTGICYSTPKAWAISVPLSENVGQYYCLDNTNDSPKISSNLLMASVCQ